MTHEGEYYILEKERPRSLKSKKYWNEGVLAFSLMRQDQQDEQDKPYIWTTDHTDPR
jgi:hypothetical protein